MVIGLGLMGQLQGPRSLLKVLVGVLGLFLAAVGAIEFGMAVWYRTKRHRLTSHPPTGPH